MSYNYTCVTLELQTFLSTVPQFRGTEAFSLVIQGLNKHIKDLQC